jgi:hypothetical protein
MTLIPTASRLSVCARASHTDDTITITAVQITRVALNIGDGQNSILTPSLMMRGAMIS